MPDLHQNCFYISYFLFILFVYHYFYVSIFHFDFQSALNWKDLIELLNNIYRIEVLTKLYKMVYIDTQFYLIFATERTFKIGMENGNPKNYRDAVYFAIEDILDQPFALFKNLMLQTVVVLLFSLYALSSIAYFAFLYWNSQIIYL